MGGRHISARGLALIKAFEGFRPTIYLCPGQAPTIGYGHTLSAGEHRQMSDGISEKQADALLREDVGVAEEAVSRHILVALTDNQFDALVSFTFNVGSGALGRSTLKVRLNQGRYDEVPAELMKWVWAGGRKLPGLIRRRQAEAALYRNNYIATPGGQS